MKLLLDAVTGPVPALAAGWLAALLLTSIQSPMLAMLIALGFAGAFVAGLVGIGGAIVMIPLLLYVPPYFGLPALDIHTASGITMVQVATAGLTGMLAHRRARNVNADLVTTLGGGMMAASLVGGAVSKVVPAVLLNGIFATLAVAGAALMLSGRRTMLADEDERVVTFSRPVAIAIGIGIGLLVGMVGAGGGFLLVPLMLYVLNVPVRIAVGSSLAIVAFSGMAGALGKAITGQVAWFYSLALVTGALPGAQYGATVSRRVPAARLAWLLGLLIAAIAIRMWWELLSPGGGIP